jgi:predicted PurR-regulated permease PerM
MNTQSKTYTLLWFTLITVTLLSLILYALNGRLLPIIGAIVLVYLTKPLQHALRNIGLSNKASASLISLSLLSVICFIIFYGLPVLVTELTRIIMQLPSNIETTYNHINQLLAPYDIALDSQELPKIISQSFTNKDLYALQSIPTILSSTIGRFIDIILFFASFLFLPLFFFFALQHSGSVVEASLSTVPQIIRDDVSDFLAILNETLSTWIAGQGSVIICLSILYTSGFYIINLPYAMTLGILTGLLYIIPAVGPMIALTLTATITIASSGLDSWVLLQVLGLYTTLQILDSLVLSPFFIGAKLGLNLPLLLFAILVGGGLLGGVGVIISVPTASVLKKTIFLIKQKQSADWIYD